MTTGLSYGDTHDDTDWGSRFAEVVKTAGLENIFVCHATVSNLTKIANELSDRVMDSSWIMDLDPGAKRAYERTVSETAKALVDIFKNKVLTEDKISSEFGEVMVSMSSARALEIIFDHISVPIAELWKPQKKQNEGFDFHTVCPEKIINFGEAKFSGSPNVNPYGGKTGHHSGAAGQADGFVEQEKHYRDRVHLVNLAESDAVDNLDNESFGVVLAFSMNATNPLTVFGHAIQKALTYEHLKKAKNIYIVGVSHNAHED